MVVERVPGLVKNVVVRVAGDVAEVSWEAPPDDSPYSRFYAVHLQLVEGAWRHMATQLIGPRRHAATTFPLDDGEHKFLVGALGEHGRGAHVEVGCTSRPPARARHSPAAGMSPG